MTLNRRDKEIDDHTISLTKALQELQDVKTEFQLSANSNGKVANNTASTGNGYSSKQFGSMMGGRDDGHDEKGKNRRDRSTNSVTPENAIMSSIGNLRPDTINVPTRTDGATSKTAHSERKTKGIATRNRTVLRAPANKMNLQGETRKCDSRTATKKTKTTKAIQIRIFRREIAAAPRRSEPHLRSWSTDINRRISRSYTVLRRNASLRGTPNAIRGPPSSRSTKRRIPAWLGSGLP